ncbi:hypothetical protein Tco_1525967 [Tanacetum coccineum]
MSIIFVIRDQFISYSLSKFGQILTIPYEGQCSLIDEWSRDALSREQYMSNPYHTKLPSPEDIRMFIQTERTGHNHVLKGELVYLDDNQILSKEVQPHMKNWVEIIRENVLFLVDRVMLFLGAPRQRKPRKDIGVKRTRHSTSSSFAFDYGSSSRQADDDENRGDEGTSKVSTPSLTTYYNSFPQNIPQVFFNPLPHEQTMENLFTRQTSMLNRQEKMHVEKRGGLKSIGKAFKKLWNKKKK